MRVASLLLDTIVRDVRYAVRTMRGNPGFTVVAVLSLALGIGANTAIFCLTDALMLRWLPVHNPQELAQLKLSTPGARRPRWAGGTTRVRKSRIRRLWTRGRGANGPFESRDHTRQRESRCRPTVLDAGVRHRPHVAPGPVPLQ